MEATAKTYQQFYSTLGRLFYGFAAVDNEVRQEEFDALKTIVSENWLPLEDSTDNYGSDAAFQIEFQFDVLIETAPEAKECFNDFKSFYEKHPSLFTDEVKLMIWRTADDVASAYASKNKSELVMLDQLRNLFEG